MSSKKVMGIVAVVLLLTTGIILYRLGGIEYKRKHAEVLKIGALLPLTGPGAEFAQYIKEGIDLAVKKISLPGIEVSVIYVDTKNNPAYAVSAYNKLVNTERPPAVIVALSSVAKALAPLADETRTVQVGIAVAIPGVTDISRYVFRIYPEAHGMAGVMAKYAVRNLGCSRIGVIYINDDFGRASLDVFKEVALKEGGKVVVSESYELLQKDFRSQAAKVVSYRPQCVYVAGYGPSYGVAIKNLFEAGFTGILTADMTLGLPTTLNQVKDVVDGAYFVDGPMDSSFVRDFISVYGKSPTSYAGYAYDQVMLLTKIAWEIQKKGESITAENLVRGLLKVRNYPGVMGEITILPNGESTLQFVVKRIEQGNIRVVYSPHEG